MPKQTKKTTKKSRDSKAIVYRSPKNAIDQPVRVTLVYTDTVLLSSSASVPFTTYTFRANSCFDPDWSGGGHQPYRWDQLTALYQRYEVVKSKIRCQFTTGDRIFTSSAYGPWQVGVATSNNATPAGTGTDPGYTLSETTRASHGALTGGMVRTCRTNWDQSLTGNNRHDASLVAGTGSNPGSEGYYIVWCFNQGNVVATDVLASVRIEYDVILSRPIQAAVS